MSHLFHYSIALIGPDDSTVAVDDVANLNDFVDDFPPFSQLQAGDESDDSGFVGTSQDLVCPCCLQELDDIEILWTITLWKFGTKRNKDIPNGHEMFIYMNIGSFQCKMFTTR